MQYDEHSRSRRLLHTIFESQVSSSPDRNAIQIYTLGSCRSITYDELNSEANRIARLIGSIKLPQANTFAICMDKGPTLIAVILAVLKLGCAWSPVDPKAPVKRKNAILQSLGDCHLLIAPEYAAEFQQFPLSTSVFVWDESICSALFHLRPETRILQFAHITFDIFALDLFMSLSIGACLILGDTAEILTDISSFMISTQTNYTQLTPSVIQLLDPERINANGRLQILASSGEPITEGIVRAWAGRLQLFNCYGPTETDVVTAHRITANSSPHCIGKELAGCKVSIRDDHGIELPRDTIGEICVSGIQVMNQYLNALNETHWHLGRPEGRIYRTGDLGKTVSSGDIFCFGRKDHQVKVRGNRVNLVDIEDTIRCMSDIESTTVLLPSAGPLQGELCCFLQVDLDGCSSHRGAVPTLEPNTSAEAMHVTKTVLEELEKSLPTAAVPTSWWLLQNTPLTTSGKVDRQALSQWLESCTQPELQLRTYPAASSIGESPSSSDTYVDTSILDSAGPEQVIRSIWAKLLNMDTMNIPTDRSFYAMGAHSLVAVRLVAAIRAHGINFTMRTLGDADTIRKQAILLTYPGSRLNTASKYEAEVPYALINAEIDRCRLMEAASTVCSVPQECIDNIYPCTPMQSGIMAASLQHPGTYICDMTLGTRDELDQPAFDVAWSQLVALEPIFRTRIAMIPDLGMFQVVLAPAQCLNPMDARLFDMGLGSPLWTYLYEDSTVHFRIHHSILDGAQVSLMLQKLSNLYDKRMKSKEMSPSQTELDAMRGTPYTQFVHSIIRNAASSGSRTFWLDMMKDQSPTDYPTVTSTVPRHSKSRALNLTIQSDYRKLAAESDVPPGALLGAIWSIVYSGFADTPTVVYGMVHSGRDAAVDGIEGIVAPTIAITPIVAGIDPRMAFVNLAASYHKALSDMIPHRHFGLQHIQALGPNYRTACEFRALLVIQSELDLPIHEGPLVLESVSEARYDYPLVLCLTMKSNQTLVIDTRYEETFISEEAVRCILNRVEDVIRQLEYFGIQRTVKSLQTPSQTHLEHIITSTIAPAAVEMRVEGIFDASALIAPQEPAIFDQELGISLTYSDVKRLSMILARTVLHRGAEPGSMIPLCIGNSAYAVLAILAIHQAGCAYVPINPEHPMKRQDVVMERVKADILLCTSNACANYSHFAGQIINVDKIVPLSPRQTSASVDRGVSEWEMAEPETYESSNPEEDGVQVRPPGSHVGQSADTASVLFTSGSTGVPKGVELTHQNIATAVHSLIDSFQLKQGTRMFQIASLAFDLSLLEIYGSWARCGCVCIPSKYSRMNRTSESLREMQVDTVIATTTVASLIRVEDASQLRTMVLAGERLSREIADRWAARICLYNLYGPTEGCIGVTSTRILPDYLELQNLGASMNARIWILDGDRKPVPSGYLGEIAISGPTVARGYLKDPARTRNSFITIMPSGSRESEQTAYLTGDFGRRTGNGDILFQGRKDYQVKINGIRIELGEIDDSIVSASPDIRSVAVIHISNRLVAFIDDGMGASVNGETTFHTITPGRNATISLIRTHLKARLPTYMLPSQFLFVTQWPKTSNGKTDRNALIAAYRNEHSMITSHSQSGNKCQEIAYEDLSGRKESKNSSWFRNTLHRVLGLSHGVRIDPFASFFDIGGDSFAAMKFVAAARTDNIGISVHDIFRNPTLSAMYDHMFGKKPEAREHIAQISTDVQKFSLKSFVDPQEVESLTGLALSLVDDIYPCTPFQEGVAALASLSKGLYVTRHVFAITPCDEARFKAALALVIERSAILRTTIVALKTLGALQLVICPEAPSSPRIKLHAAIADLKSQPVQLEDQYLFNFDLVVKDGSINTFAVTMSHAAYDGWSQELLLQDISTAYCEGSLLPPSATFASFISYQHQTLHHPRTRQFWSAYLSNAQSSSWPYEPRHSHESIRADQRYSSAAKVSWPSQGRLKSAILRGAWALLLAKYENTRDPCFGTIFSGRASDFPHIESVRGPTMSAVVAHVILDPEESVAGFLKRQQDDFTAMSPHSAYGLQNIRKISEDAANACEFRTMLVIQPMEISEPKSTRKIAFELIEETMPGGYAVTLDCVPTQEGIKLSVSYDTVWICFGEVQRLAEQYLHVVKQMSIRVYDESTLNDIDMVPIQDLEQIQRWNSTQLKPQKKNLYELFQAAARKYPYSPAIEGPGGQVISYWDLELHVCAVADILKSNGVKAHHKILIRMDKSPHQISAVLAILRVGATFVPIDIEWPQRRVKRIAEYTAAAFALVDLGKSLFETPPSLLQIAVHALPSKTPDPAGCHDPPDLVEPEDLAYIVYTSGSTGEPKGILIPHIAACTAIVAHQHHLDLNFNSRVFQFASLTFDMSITDIFGTLSVGGCICLPTEHERLFELEKTIQERQANWISLTPSVASLLNPENVPTVKTLALGGELVSQSLLDTWVDKVHLINKYGPTETTITTTVCHLSGDPYCIGNGIGTTSTWIVDPHNHTRLAPIGAVGELLCVGPAVAYGYLNNPEGSSKAFVTPPPWVDQQSKAWKAYRTGDLVRYNADSSIRILGRADRQLKLRGKRVELAEIDTAIIRTGVVDQVVTDVIRRNETPLLVSFITVVASDMPETSTTTTTVLRNSHSQTQTVQHIRSSIQQDLPVYMQPWAIIVVNAIPRSSSGKVDRHVLQSIAKTWSPEDQEATHAALKSPSSGTMSRLELTVQELWSEVLGIEKQGVGSNDTFARLGGDSLSLMRLAFSLRAKGHFADVSKVHLGLTLKQMVQLFTGIDQARETRKPPDVEPFSLLANVSIASLRETIRRYLHTPLDDIVDAYPMSPMQIALIASSAKSPGSYTNKITFTLPKSVDLDRLDTTVRQTVEHQEILRTVFLAEFEGASVQAVLRNGSVVQRGPPSTEESLQNEQVPRVYLPAVFYLERTNACVYLHVIIHHAAMDAFSIQMLAHDLHCTWSAQPLLERPAYRTFIRHIEMVHSKDDTREAWEAFSDRTLPTQTPIPEGLETPGQPGQCIVQVQMPPSTESEWSPSELLTAALAILLRHKSGASSICFGLVLSGRLDNLDGLEKVAGPTFTTIPMMCDVEPMASKQALLQAMRDDLQRIRTHQQFGLSNIAKLNDCARKATSFTTLMVIQPESEANNQGIFDQHTCEALRPTAQYPLEIECKLSRGAAEIKMAYDGKVIGAKEADWLSNHLKQIVERDLIGNEQLMQPLQDSMMITNEDEMQIDAWNSTVIVPETRSLHTRFSETATRYPEAEAIVFDDTRYTYNELDHLSSVLAHHLVSHGVERRDRVPLMFEKSATVVVAMLAVLKTGAAYVPLDPLQPKARLQSMKDAIGSDIILCDPSMQDRCQLWNRQILTDHSLLLLLQAQGEKHQLTGTVSFEDPAYIMFTSGSSGTPKGVVISHGAASTSIRDQISSFNFGSGSRIMHFCSYTFDVSVMEIFATLTSGATLFIPSEQDRMSSLVQYMQKNEIQTAILTPTVVRSFLKPERVPSLCQLILVGEPCNQNLISEWCSCVQLINDYGPTETTIDSATNTNITKKTKATNVGRSISGHLWIARQTDPRQLCPLGVAGELLISGPTLANGYLNDPERTSQAFIDGTELPWAQKMTANPSRLYKTGDLARYSQDGEINILGRIDSQIKLKGLRIEVQEIEYALEGFEPSLRAGVLLTRSASGEDSLFAVVSKDVWRRNSESSALQLTEELSSWIDLLSKHVAKVLPGHMRPSSIVPLTHLPTMTSGKLDRRKLGEIAGKLVEKGPLMRQCQSSSNTSKIVVFAQSEYDLRDQWARTLGVDVNEIYPDSDFFSMGGDSLSAMKLSSAFNTNRRLSVKSIFQYPALGDMAKAVETVSLAGATGSNATLGLHYQSRLRLTTDLFASVAEICGVRMQEIENVFPCSPLQEGLFTASLLSSGSYCACLAYRLAPEVDLGKFCASWETVYQSNPILRTRIVRDYQETTHFLQAAIRQQLRWRIVDTEGAATEQFDVALGGELTRWIILNGKGGARRFMLFIHHALYDDITLKNIFSDFAQLYTKGFLDVAPRLFGMQHYIGFLESLDESGMIEEWKTLLEGAIALPFPPRKSPSYKPLTNRTTEILTANARSGDPWRSNQTSILRAAWLLTIARHQHAVCDGVNVCFGTVLSSRTSAVPGLEQVIGPMIQSVPVVEFVNRTETLSDFLQRIRAKYVRAMDSGHLGLKKIRSIGPAHASACDFNNLFVIANGEPEEDYLQNDRIEGFTRLKQELQHPYGLVFECTPTPTGVTFSASYDSTELEELAVSRLLDHFGTAFGRLIELRDSSTAKVSEVLSYLSNDAESSLVCSWNEIPAIPDDFLHERFLAAAKRWPGREAVFAHDRSMTYKRLDQESSSLADELANAGVRAGSTIPICFEKSSYMLVTILAVLRAGGAYVPISPDHPPKRQAYIIGQCNTELLLASSEQAKVLREALHTTKTFICVDQLFFNRQPVNKMSPPSTEYPATTSKSLAYILYTSGSTGTPKGVAVSHGAVARSMVRHADCFGHALGDGLRSLQFCNYTFDVSIMDIFPTLSFGGCVCIPSEADRFDNISSFIRRSRADLAMLTPTVADMLDPAEVSNLRTLVVGGEPMTEAVRNKWTDPTNVPERTLYNVYGPTEASVNVTTFRMTSKTRPSTIGSAVLGSQLWIAEVDDCDRLAPLGCDGELIITGPCLADGYLHAPDQTAKAFIKAPSWLPTRFASTAYRTGDLARFAANGVIEIIGRIDAQVKLHGIRIELGEIEEVACRVEHVNSAVAVVSNKRGRDEISLFYDSLHGQDVMIQRAIYEQLKCSLPPAFIPSLYICSTIPMTGTGKIDRKAIAQQMEGYDAEELSRFTIDAPNSSKRTPETMKQRELRALWMRALRVKEEDVWLDTNFFSIGGDSVGVIVLVSMMQRAGYPVTYKDVFAQPILEHMALLMHKVGKECNALEDPKPFEMLVAGPSNRHSLQTRLADVLNIPAGHICDAYPCSDMQTSLIAASLRTPKAYWCTIDLELAPDIDAERLLSSWEAVVMQNSIMRTVIIHTEEYGNIQVVVDSDPRIVLGAWDKERVLLNKPLSSYSLDSSRTGRKVFRLTMHHVIYDLWVQEALLGQLSQIYNGKQLEGNPSFSRFIRFEQQQDDSAAFWKKSVQGASVVKFPNYRTVQNPGETLMTMTAERMVKIPHTRTSAHSIATIIHCAYALVLSRYGYASDVCYPSVQSGRNIPLQAASDIVGPLMTTSFFRADCSHDRTVDEMFEDASQFLLDAASHQHAAHTVVPRIFGQSIAEMGSMLVVQPRTRLSESKFDLFSRTGTEMAQPGLLLVAVTIEDESSVSLKIQYAPEAMEKAHVQLFMSHLQRAIEQLTEPQMGTKRSLGSISLITEHDENIAMRGSGTPMPPTGTVVDAMRHVAAKYPNAIAINAHDGTLTYSELLDQATKLAAMLRLRLRRRAGSEVRIAVCSERNAMAVVIQAAIFSIRDAAFIALDPTSPVERNSQIVEDSDADIVLFSPCAINSAEHIASGRDILQISRQILDDLPVDIDRDSKDAKPHANSVAYITYTSGSTGRPKGCVMEHGPLAITILKLTEWKEIDPTFNTLWGSTWSFDVHLSQIWEPLTTGGAICVPSEDEMHKSAEATLTRYNVHHAFFTPTQAHMIEFSRTPSLRSLAMGGESINFNLLPLFEAGLRVFNEYGPSEAAGCVTGHELTLGDQEKNKIGRALFGNCWAVEPGSLSRLAPIGTIGELVAGGTLARGYLNRPEMTREAFFDSPVWVRGLCPRLYRTGDLVCQDLDGSFRYLGRADTQVKINGVRIEVAEIESAITEVDPSVNAIVAALDSGNEERTKILVAFISEDCYKGPSSSIRKTIFEDDCANIRGKLARILPRTMIPRVWIPLSNAQRTSTGKVNRKAVQEVFQTHMQTLSTEKRPKSNEVFTDAENIVRNLWASVLKCDQSELNKSTSFFDLGDSITAIGLVAAAARLGHHVSVASIYKNSGLSEMALLMQDNKSPDSLLIRQDPPAFSLLCHDALSLAKEDLEENMPDHTTIEDIFPVTPLQEVALVSNHRWHRAYYAWFVIEVTGGHDLSKLRAACNQVVEIHPVLRTLFFQSGATLYQAQVQNMAVDYQEILWNSDMSHVPHLIEESCPGEPSACYNPTRFRLLQHTTTHGLLAIGLSHAQYDGICLSSVLDNLIAIYNGSTIAPQPSFSRLVQLLNLQTQVAEAQAFWSTRLHGSTMTNLVRCPNTSRPLLDRKVTAYISLPNPSTTERRVHASLCLAWAITLEAATGVSDVVFGTLTSGRSAPIQDVYSMTGPCITTIPVRVNLGAQQSINSSKDTMTIGEALDQVHGEHIETQSFEHLGLRRIVKSCTDWPSTTRFSSMVQYQNIDPWDPSSDSSFPSKPGSDGVLQWKNRGSIAYKGLCDEVDVWVTGVSRGENRTDLTMLFSEETLPKEAAENLLCVLTVNFESILKGAQESVTELSEKSIKRLGGVRLPIEARRELRRITQAEAATIIQEALPRTSRSLQAIWCRVLGLAPEKQFAPSDSFYMQGGDSIGAAMVAGLAQAQGFSLSPQDAVECETFGEQVRRIEQGSHSMAKTNALEWDVTDMTAES
ncbi:hypothetical protein BKA58DRAFT_450075 [Alternaria rosae]|uniref:uncharacterized protein n=1 Tax=Alternaria rosae TaxID=1187941 RepID=UPI001E8D1513|nr:uncharacterized protein BKA58DRAFT_450075 [Alternaria rosae]KAH6857477.1 hypothetical protein BKA58DRAFT_450075 [Alternaria rosae]